MNFLKTVGAFSLFGAVWASVDGNKFSIDDNDSGATDEIAVDQELNGMGIRVYQQDGVPQIIMYEGDSDEYCFRFDSSFEASSYNSTTCEYEIVGDSKFEFSELSWNYEECNQTAEDCIYNIWANGVDSRFDTLAFHFKLSEDENGTLTKLKFDVTLDNYAWADDTGTASWVLVLDMDDCSDAFDKDGSTDTTTEEESRRRMRRLMEDDGDTETGTDTEEEEEEDDSKEFELGDAFFAISPLGNGDGGVDNVNVFMCVQESGEVDGVHVVYSNFNSDLYQDPYAWVDTAANADTGTGGNTGGDGSGNDGAANMAGIAVFSAVLSVAMAAWNS